ncbi:hypothetical protein B0H34DRAFT_816566 [Crassisporium funariophilum]|nr:hypothetical protein B0H34DRAFT_816566 [Crassisporium funariophilum]
MSSTETIPKNPRRKSAKEGYFSWLGPAIRSRRTLKTWFRCCVAVAVTMILLVDNSTSLSMGQAAFFAAIVAVMLPPTFALSVFIMAILTLLLGMLIGWAWGSAAMAAALSVRSSSLLAQQQQKLQSSLVPGEPIALQIQNQTFHGIFLDPRSSAVYGAFFFIGNFAMGAIRAYIPSLTLLGLFGSIVLDVMCTTGPLLPTAQYTIPKAFIIPTCYYVAVALASIVLIFPESLSHVWLTSFNEDFWTPILELLRLQAEALNAMPSDHEEWAEINNRGHELRQTLINGTDNLTKQIGLINLDTSLGRLGPADLRKINAELRSVMFRAGGLHSFSTFVNDTNIADEKEEKAAESKLSHGKANLPSADRYQILRQKVRKREIQHGHDLDSLVPILASSSMALRSTCESGVICVMDWFQECNTRRWSAFLSRSDKGKIEERRVKLEGQMQQLEEALDEFRSVQRVKLVEPYKKFFDPETKRLLKTPDDPDMFASKSLFICFVFLDTIDAFAERLIVMLKMVIELNTQRPRAKFWFPGRLAQVKKDITVNAYGNAAGPLSMGTSADPTAFDSPSNRSSSEAMRSEDYGDEAKEEVLTEPPREPTVYLHMWRKRNPDAFPPTTAFGKFFVRLSAVFRFLKSAEGIFALRLGIVSVALWIPAVCHSSAWFYYANKGLWALIMAQTGLALYAGDQIASLIVRFAGTLVGLVLGMVVWYIGAARGPGNPYGIVIASTVFIAPFLLARIAAPPAQLAFWIMIPVTIIFVAGYSWVNANQVIFANPGIGVALGWKRALLVLIGFTAAFIVMLFPNPISSRVLVRKALAASTGEFGIILAGEVEAFLAEEARARSGHLEKVEFVGNQELDETKVSAKEKRVRKIAKRVIAVATRLVELAPSLGTARYEPQLSGTWPHEQYQTLFHLQAQILTGLVLLITSFAKLDAKWCSILVHRTPFLNPNFLSDIFTTLSILSSSLMNGHPLPAYLPKLRDRLIYHEYHSGRRLNPSLGRIGLTKPRYESDSDEVNEDGASSAGSSEHQLDCSAGRVDGSSIGLEELTLDVLMDEQLPAHSTAVVALSSIISRIDEMAEIVRTLCGEATFAGYESLQRDYLDREERAYGSGLSAKMR